MTDFDEIHDRSNTNSVKWDSLKNTYQEEDLLPMWVADMDFLSPDFVREDLQAYLDSGVLGYAEAPESLYQAIIDWQKRQHQFTVKKEEILFSSGVVPSIALAVQAYTKTGDGILIHDPVYHPFAGTVLDNHRKLIRSRLIEKDGHFEMDFADMEQQIQTKEIKMFILCNPHNPGGRVWSKAELIQVGKLCQKYGVLIISDEIHQDLIFPPYQFTTFQNAFDPEGEMSITLTAATKTFNLAGIKNSMIFIKNKQLRDQFSSQQKENHMHQINTFGFVGTESAYRKGEDWLAELLRYLQKNITFVEDYLKENLPKVTAMHPEGTYLIWLDFSAYGLSDKELENLLVHKGKVVLNTGISFGPSGAGRMRLNIAAPLTTIQEGMERIKKALAELD